MKGDTCQWGVVGCGVVMMLSRDLVATPPCLRHTVAAVGAARDPTKAPGCEALAACLRDADATCCCIVVLACCARRQQAASILVALGLPLKRDVAKADDVDDEDRGAQHWLHAAQLGFADWRKDEKVWQGCES